MRAAAMYGTLSRPRTIVSQQARSAAIKLAPSQETE
jgi:hypothetical protein